MTLALWNNPAHQPLTPGSFLYSTGRAQWNRWKNLLVSGGCHCYFTGRALGLFITVLSVAPAAFAEKVVLRVGHFPNITHAQGVIGHGFTRRGKGWFEQRLGPEVQVQWFVYNAGPTSMEAIFARSIDLTYVGPNPAINAHLKARGEEIRIVVGACSGGAALIVQPDGRIKTDADFKGKKVATPQLGNTQDVAARAWLQSKKFRITLTGGDALVVPTPNPDPVEPFGPKAIPPKK